MHQQGESVCQKALLWSQKSLTACEMMVKEMEAQAKKASAEMGL